MNELKVFSNTEFGELGIMLVDGKEFFPATQCAKILGYASPKDAISAHCKGAVKRRLPTNGGQQEVKYIPEGDLYRLIVRSQLPTAVKFEKWVFDEVLPSIRKNGGYAPNIEDLIAKTATAVVSEVVKQLMPVLMSRTVCVEPEDETIEEVAVTYKRNRRKPKSAIGCLDFELRETVEDMLFDCRYSYEDIVEFLRKKGVKISRSSVARYYRWLVNTAERKD